LLFGVDYSNDDDDDDDDDDYDNDNNKEIMKVICLFYNQ